MSDVVFVVCGLAAVIASALALRTVRQREPHWQLLGGVQCVALGMMILLIVSSSVHSPTLDLIDVAYALGFIALSLYAGNIQKRSAAGR